MSENSYHLKEVCYYKKCRYYIFKDENMEYRIERDTLGEIKVPADKLWAAQTQRSKENFPDWNRANAA